MENDRQLVDNDNVTAQHAAARLVAVFSEVMRVPANRIHADLVPEQVPQWDSVRHMALILAIEEEFDIQFDVDDIMEFVSLASILKVVERIVGQAHGLGSTERVA
jgi:acyl carrier protein